MYIREATSDDNGALIALQGKCPQGTTLIVSTINTPDFFARAKVYEDYKIYVMCDDKYIIASAACGLRKARINDKVQKVGHEFQTFVDPEYRGKRIAGQLHQVREDYLIKQGSVLSYAIIMEGNLPSMQHTERQGFKRYQTLVMPSIAVFQEMTTTQRGNIRPMVLEDLPTVTEVVNGTWKEYDFYEQITAEDLSRLIARIPEYHYEDIYVLEEDGKIVAVLGFWDWSKVTKVTVKAFSIKMRLILYGLNAMRVFRPMPNPPKVGKTLKQIVLTPIGFKELTQIVTLLKYMNNKAYSEGIEQIFFIINRNHPILSSLKGFIHIDTRMHLYVKPLKENLALSGLPVFINGLDL
jgi:GNAT superfamily N-acetyltransferase